ncbi:MAG TPA: sugar transferase [Gemmatimonadales bacterium]|nr:sugar transferase [Gemmatimonadales bacterium]
MGTETKPSPVVSHRRRAPDDDPVARALAEVDWEAALPKDRGPFLRTRLALKRAIDVGLSGLALLLLLPVFVVLGVLIVIDSGGPIFYPWRVIGYRGRRFTGYKLRTMVPDADQLKDHLAHLNEMQGPVFKMRDDPRVTALGRLLRKYSLDELPQLWSVLVGDMSLVGPRPLSAEEFIEATPLERRKLSVVPGITCIWQVSGRNEIDSFADWVRLDLEYIRTWSLTRDVAILLRTLPVVVRGTGAY